MMQRGFDNMPSTLQSRFKDRARVLFDAVYAEVADGVLRGRLDEDGVRYGSTSIRKMPWDTYVGTLVRAVRNSSHGLLQAHKTEVEVAATHTGACPTPCRNSSRSSLSHFWLTRSVCGRWRCGTSRVPRERCQPLAGRADRS